MRSVVFSSHGSGAGRIVGRTRAADCGTYARARYVNASTIRADQTVTTTTNIDLTVLIVGFVIARVLLYVTEGVRSRVLVCLLGQNICMEACIKQEKKSSNFDLFDNFRYLWGPKSCSQLPTNAYNASKLTEIEMLHKSRAGYHYVVLHLI